MSEPRIVDSHMRAYYDRRAREYDDWWLGDGRFAEVDRPGWRDEVQAVIAVVAGLRACPSARRGLRHGISHPAPARPGGGPRSERGDGRSRAARGCRTPRVVQGDAVPLPFADGEFDRVFTGHFYGHLLPDERTAFVAEARRVAGELVVVDSAVREGVDPEQWQQRVLNDGSEHRVYKRYFVASELADELGGGDVLHAGTWFVAVRCE